jgi:DNA-binding IclR family transcriptional regulator
VTCTKEQLETYYAKTTGQSWKYSLLDNSDAAMFVPPIPMPWFKAAMEATKGRGCAAIAAVWLESRLQSRETFTIRKSITDKLGITKKGRQTMVEHLQMMQEAGLVELDRDGKKYPRVRILRTKS